MVRYSVNATVHSPHNWLDYSSKLIGPFLQVHGLTVLASARLYSTCKCMAFKYLQVHGFTVHASAWLYSTVLASARLYSTCKCMALQYMQVHGFPRKFMALYLQINKALYMKVHGLTCNFMALLASSWPYLQVSTL